VMLIVSIASSVVVLSAALVFCVKCCRIRSLLAEETQQKSPRCHQPRASARHSPRHSPRQSPKSNATKDEFAL
jgi:hypothetical protein